MEKVCGFKDNRGHFHETEEACKLSDIRIRLGDIQEELIEKVNKYQAIYYTSWNAVRQLLDNAELTQEYFSKMAELAKLETKPELIYPAIKTQWWKFW